MKNANLRFSYQAFACDSGMEWRYAKGLDEMLVTGCYKVRLLHNDMIAFGISTGSCTREHYMSAILFVTESGTDGRLQKDRTVGQLLLLADCAGGSLQTFKRVCSFTGAGFLWGEWQICTGTGEPNGDGATIEWDSSSSMNSFVTAGIYNIRGMHTSPADGLPLAGAATGSCIHAKLLVLDCSVSGSEGDKRVTQILTLSSRADGCTAAMYVRTGRASDKNMLLDGKGWSDWGIINKDEILSMITAEVSKALDGIDPNKLEFIKEFAAWLDENGTEATILFQEISQKVDKSSIVHTTGDSAEKVMSQESISESIVANASVFKTFDSSVPRADIALAFIKDIRIYTDTPKEISLFLLSRNGNDYKMQFAYTDEAEGVYYMQYNGPINDDCCVISGNGFLAHIYVNKNALPDGVQVSNMGRKAFVLSSSCFFTGDRLFGLDAKVVENKQKIDEVKGCFTIDTVVEDFSVEKDTYIDRYNGVTKGFEGYELRKYPVEEGTTISVCVEGNTIDTAAAMYAIYSDDSVMDETTLLNLGPALSPANNGKHTLNLPAGSRMLALSVWKKDTTAAYSVSESRNSVEGFIDSRVNKAIANADSASPVRGGTSCYVELRGDVLMYCSKHSPAKDIIIHFKPCMNNELVTFTNVGLADNTSQRPGEDFGRSLVLLNSPGSDNIGPLNIPSDASVGTGSGGFCGGNHCYAEQYGNGQVRTACSDYHRYYLDDVPLDDGFKGYGKVLKVVTENTIFDPRVAPSAGETILSSPLAKELVSYTVQGAQIEVGVTHKYLKDVKVNKYYGQQSVFRNKSHILTPHGQYGTWTAVDEVSAFTNADYPDYKACSMKSGNSYENDILLGYGLGNRYMISEADRIFHFSGSKTYTTLISNKEMVRDAVTYWAGIYSWATPVIDDENNYIYTYSSCGRDYITICSKREYSGIQVTCPVSHINSLVSSAGGTITVREYAGGCLVLDADGVGCVTLEYNALPIATAGNAETSAL